MSYEIYDVVIVGAGIAGAVLANLLAKKTSLSIALLDVQSPLFSFDSTGYSLRVSAINCRAVQVLHDLDCWSALQAQRVSPYTHMSVWDDSTIGKIDFDCVDVRLPALGYIVENELIQEVLLKALQGNSRVTCRWPVELVAFEEEHDGVLLKTKDERYLKARLVIAADGAHSWVRKAAAIESVEAPYDQIAIVATIKTAQPHQHTARQVFLPTGPLALLPLSDPQAHSIVWSCDVEKADRLLAMTDVEFCAALSSAFDFHLGDVVSTSKRASFPLTMRHAKDYVKPRLALVGDAAHTIHPLAGQGLNIAIADVIELAHLISDACQKGKPFYADRLLRQYARARKAENTVIVKAMGGFKALFASQLTPVMIARSQGLRLFNRCSFIKKTFIKRAMGMIN